MTHYACIADAQDDYGLLLSTIQPGDTVQVSIQWVATITREGIDCDCGKGVLCPLHPQVSVMPQPLRYHTLDLISHVCLTCDDWPDSESRVEHLTRTAYQPVRVA